MSLRVSLEKSELTTGTCQETVDAGTRGASSPDVLIINLCCVRCTADCETVHRTVLSQLVVNAEAMYSRVSLSRSQLLVLRTVVDWPSV